MPITFTQVPTISPGDRITSAQHNKLARAVNDRLRSGIGDGDWRIHYMMAGATRQVRNPDSSGLLWPANLEYMETYVHVDPTATAYEWPVEGPGEPEGANLANPLMAYMYGNPSVASESNRLGVMTLWLEPLGPAPTTLEEFWQIGVLQRGLIDPVAGEEIAPAFIAAQQHFRIVQPAQGYQGRSYGGFAPQPEDIGDCGDGGSGIPPTRDVIIKFTRLSDSHVVSYPGTCPGVTGDVQWIAETPFAWWVWVEGQEQIDAFPKNEWIHGPYEDGGKITKQDGTPVQWAQWMYIKDYRGTDEEREEYFAREKGIKKMAFDFQRFLNAQYFLSPNIGHVEEIEEEEVLVADYPTFTLEGPAAAATLADYAGGGTEHEYAAGFVLGGIYATAEGLESDLVLEILDGSEVIGRVTLTAAEPGAQKWWDDAGQVTLKVRATRALIEGESYELRATEQMEYKPGSHDAAMVLRLSSTIADMMGTLPDGGGRWTNSLALSERWFNYGCVLNFVTPALPPETTLSAPRSVTLHPVIESKRKFARDNLRVIRRQSLKGYAVEDGKSVLWFDRYRQGGPEDDMDLWKGIGPRLEPIPSGELEIGVEYVVRGEDEEGVVTHDGEEYGADDTFTAAARTYEVDGELEVYEVTGIRQTAGPGGSTQQWLMFPQFKAYHTSESSIWKPEAYSDYWGFSERCHFYTGHISSTNHPDLLRHFQGGQMASIVYAPEAPTGYRYAKGTNNINFGSMPFDMIDFFRSCQVYEPSPEIESAVMDGAELKITFKTRFHHHHSDAPASLARDVSGWNVTALRAEDYRTAENAIREYLVFIHDGTNATNAKAGDTGSFSVLYGLPDDPFGTVFPHFFFTRLVPEVHEDGNSTQDGGVDVPVTMDSVMQAVYYTRAMCEGYIDGAASEERGCDLVGVSQFYDFTWANLCFQAFGKPDLSLMPGREDNPYGWGPLPRTRMLAQTYNEIGACLNLLTRARLDAPMKIECRTSLYQDVIGLEADWLSGTGGDCTTMGEYKAIKFGYSPAAASTLVDSGEWAECPSISAESSAGFLGECHGEEGAHAFITQRQVIEYRFAPVNPDFAHAIPPGIQELIDGGSVGFFAWYYEDTVTPSATAVGAGSASPCEEAGDTPFWWDGSEGYLLEAELVSADPVCRLVSGGQIDFGAPPGGDFWSGYNISGGGWHCAVTSLKGAHIEPANAQITTFLHVPLVP